MHRGFVIVLALVTFFVGDRLGGAILENVLYRSPQRFPSLYEGRLGADIVSIGNSRGVYLLDLPMVEERTGRSIVNISHNGMTPLVAEAVFADYLEYNRKPQMLVVEISFMTVRTTPSIVLDYKPFWGRSERLQTLAERFSYKSVVASQTFHLYRYNSEIFLRALSYWLSGKNDQRGFMNNVITHDLIAETEQMDPFRLEIPDDEFEALQRMVQLAQQQGIEVVPVMAPYLPAYAERTTNLDEVIAQFTQATGLEVLDFSRSVEQIDHFADRVHLHRRGTRSFTESLIELGVFEFESDGADRR